MPCRTPTTTSSASPRSSRLRLPSLFERFQLPATVHMFEKKNAEVHAAPPPQRSTRAAKRASPRRKQAAPPASTGPALMEALPLDMLYEVAKFAAGDMGDLKTLSLLCRTGQSLAANLAANENAKLYENEFRKRDPVLHECIAQSEDARSTWKGRLVKIIQYKHDSKRDVLSLDAAAVGGERRRHASGSSSGSSGRRNSPRSRLFSPASSRSDSRRPTSPASFIDSTSSSFSSSSDHHHHHSNGSSSTVFSGADPRNTPTLVDVTLYNHPNLGFLVNVGETSRSIVIYGLRSPLPSPDGHTVKSSAQTLLSPLKLPIFQTGEPAPQGPSQNNLVMMYSINGKRICDFTDFHDLIQYIKSADDLCRWRMLFYPRFDVDQIPEACQFKPVPRPALNAIA